jgi:hypothetical protein
MSEQACLAGPNLSPFPLGVVMGGEVMRLSGAVWLRQEEGVMADPDLSVWPGSLGLARPQSFGPLIVDILRPRWPAN